MAARAVEVPGVVMGVINEELPAALKRSLTWTIAPASVDKYFVSNA